MMSLTCFAGLLVLLCSINVASTQDYTIEEVGFIARSFGTIEKENWRQINSVSDAKDASYLCDLFSDSLLLYGGPNVLGWGSQLAYQRNGLTNPHCKAHFFFDLYLKNDWKNNEKFLVYVDNKLALNLALTGQGYQSCGFQSYQNIPVSFTVNHTNQNITLQLKTNFTKPGFFQSDKYWGIRNFQLRTYGCQQDNTANSSNSTNSTGNNTNSFFAYNETNASNGSNYTNSSFAYNETNASNGSNYTNSFFAYNETNASNGSNYTNSSFAYNETNASNGSNYTNSSFAYNQTYSQNSSNQLNSTFIAGTAPGATL